MVSSHGTTVVSVAGGMVFVMMTTYPGIVEVIIDPGIVVVRVDPGTK